MPERSAVVACLKNIRAEIDDIVGAARSEAWSAPTYEDGWTARDVLSHIASTSGVASYVLMLARSGGGTRPGSGAFDQDAFNRQQVAMRAERSVDDVADEIRSNIQRDIQAIGSANEKLLHAHFAAPWGIEGSVAQVIIDSLNGHLGGHLADLRGALLT